MVGHPPGSELAHIHISHTMHYNTFQVGHKKPEKEMEKPVCFNCEEEKTFCLLTKQTPGTGWMELNVFLKAFCATESNKANTKMKAIEEGEVHVANKAFYPK